MFWFRNMAFWPSCRHCSRWRLEKTKALELSYFVGMRDVSKQQRRHTLLPVRKMGAGVRAYEEWHGPPASMGSRYSARSNCSSTDLCGSCRLAGMSRTVEETNSRKPVRLICGKRCGFIEHHLVTLYCTRTSNAGKATQLHKS